MINNTQTEIMINKIQAVNESLRQFSIIYIPNRAFIKLYNILCRFFLWEIEKIIQTISFVRRVIKDI